jgi:hypothetical protein
MEEESGEEFTSIEEMIEQPGEREEGPALTEVSDRLVSIGEAPAIVPKEERPQEQEQEQEQVQQEPKISKRKQKRRTTSYLSNISKQVEKNGNQINKIIMIVQSIQKQNQIKSIKGAEVSQLPLQLIKQVQAQVSLLQKQMTRIQKDIQRIRIKSAIVTSTKIKPRNRAFSTTNIKRRSKKSKSLKNIRIRRQSR